MNWRCNWCNGTFADPVFNEGSDQERCPLCGSNNIDPRRPSLPPMPSLRMPTNLPHGVIEARNEKRRRAKRIAQEQIVLDWTDPLLIVLCQYAKELEAVVKFALTDFPSVEWEEFIGELQRRAEAVLDA